MFLKKRKMDFYDLLTYSGVSERTTNNLRILKGTFEEMDKFLDRSVYLHGPVGSGKTTLAAAILAEVIKTEYPSYEYILNLMDPKRNKPEYDQQYIPSSAKQYIFTTLPKFLQRIRETFNKQYEGPTESQIIEQYADAELLVIDDIGIEMTTDWSFQLFYLLVDERYGRMKNTIFTSNFSLLELCNKFSDSRIPSRIAGMCKGRIFEITGEDKRIK
jgi:DNA replication protein DnaC